MALQGDGWIVRNDITWHKPNALPESVTDRLSGRHQRLFLLTWRPKYYFDLDAVRVRQKTRDSPSAGQTGYRSRRSEGAAPAPRSLHPGGANPGDVWAIPNRTTPEAHHARFPIDLPLRCIAAGCPADGVVLDPFSGAGTTGAAALQLGRRYLGVDLIEAYHDLAIPKLDSAGLLERTND